MIEQLPDLDDSLQAMDDDVHVGPVVVRRGFAQDFAAGLQLVADLLEPKFVGLVHDDEEHLVVREQLSVLQAERFLQLEEFVDPEIVAVILQRTLGIERALHPVSVAQREGRRQCAGQRGRAETKACRPTKRRFRS